MKIKEFRILKGLSQQKIADELSQVSLPNTPKIKKRRCAQRTYASWEQGVIPRPYWLKVIESYTKHAVQYKDFLSE